MTPAQAIVEEIETVLKAGSVEPAKLSRIATDYAKVCSEVNGRLVQIQEILDGGDELQAFLMAERPPEVMDEADTLCFAGLATWSQLCAKNGVQMPPEIKTKVVHRLNELYAKGLTSNHRIYKDFRAAVLARDNEKALQLARAIEKTTPGDTQAAGERLRLERKVWQQRLESLENALKEKDDASVEAALARVQELTNLLNEAGPQAAVEEADARLKESRARAAAAECRQWIQQAGVSRTGGRWQDVGEHLTRIEETAARHGLKLEPEIEREMSGLKEYFLKMHAEYQEQRAFMAALKKLLEGAELIESESQATGIVKLPRLIESLATLNRNWQKVESFRRPVDEATIQRVARLVEFLRTEIARNQRSRLLVVAGSLAAAIAIAAASGWWLIGMYRAGESAREIAAAMEGDLVEGVQRLIDSAELRGLPRFSAGLETQIEAGRAWIAEKSSSFELSSRAVAHLEALLENNFAGAEPEELRANIEAAHSAVESLPREQQGTLRQRLAQIKPPLDLFIREKGAEAVLELQTELERFERQELAPLKEKQPLQEFAKHLETAENLAKNWSQKVRPNLPEYDLPPEVRAQAEAMQENLTKLRVQFNALQSGLESMYAAGNIDDYYTALTKASESPLLQIDEVQSLRTASLIRANPEEIVAELVFPWNPSAWPAFKQGGEAENLHPREILPAEDSALADLINNEFSQNIYFADLVARPNRRVFTKGSELSEEDVEDYSSYEPRTYRSFFGNVYDPEVDGPLIRFRPRTLASNKNGSDYARSARSKGLSPASKISDAMRLRDMLQNIQVNLPVWEILDRAHAADAESPLYQAFIVQQIDRLVSVRPMAWGIHFTPSGKQFLQAIKTAMGGRSVRSGDWMRIKPSDDSIRKLTEVLPKETYFLQEARINRALAIATKEVGGLQFVGFVGSDGMPIIPKATADVLWGMEGTPGQSKPAPLYVLSGKQGSGPAYRSLSQPPAFSPVFAFAGDRIKTLKRAQAEAAVDDARLSQLTICPLFEEIPSP